MTINIFMHIYIGEMPIGTYTPPPLAKALHNFFFHFRCILLQISHQKCFFISISIPGRSGVKEKKIFLHASDPFLSQNIPSEKIIFRDVPFDCNNSHIMNYLRTQPQIRIRSDVITGKIRNANNELTEFLNGDRYVYVEAGFSPVLEQETTINGHTCRIWHSNQAMKCKRCSGDNHRTTDAVECPAYIDEPEDVIIFWESKHVFSNFYMCNIKLFDLDFKSAEHCYQYCKLRYIGQDELAQEILLCDTPRQAKQIAMKIPGHLMI